MEAQNADFGFVISVYLELREPTHVTLPIAMVERASAPPSPPPFLPSSALLQVTR